MTFIEQQRIRIASKGIRGRDIKVPGLLTDDEIATLDVDKIYMWLRQSDWSRKDFKQWLKTIRVIE